MQEQQEWAVLEPVTLTERVYGILRTRIIAGDWAPGHFLREKELSGKLGVSRTPVREALARLAADGFLERIPHRGRAGLRLPSDVELALIQPQRYRLVPTVEHNKQHHLATNPVSRLKRRTGDPLPQHSTALHDREHPAALPSLHLLDDLQLHHREQAALVVALAEEADNLAVHHSLSLGRQCLDRQRHLACRLAKRDAGQ